MKRAALLVLLVSAAAEAREIRVPEVGFRVGVPDDFKEDPEVLPQIVKSFHDPERMLGAPYHVGGFAMTADKKAAVLYVLYRISNEAIDTPGPVIRAEIEDFLTRPSAVQIASSTEQLQDKVAAARIDYKPADKLYSEAKAVMYVDDQGILYDVHVECTVTEERLDDLAPICGAVVDSLAVIQPADKLKPLGAVPPPPKKPPKVVKPDAGPATPPVMATPASGPSISPINIPPEPPSVWPKVIIYGGLGMIGLALLWLVVGGRKKDSR